MVCGINLGTALVIIIIFFSEVTKADTTVLFNLSEFETLITPKIFSEMTGYDPSTPYELMDVSDSPSFAIFRVNKNELIAKSLSTSTVLWKAKFDQNVINSVIADKGIYTTTSGTTIGVKEGDMEGEEESEGLEDINVIFIDFAGKVRWRRERIVSGEESFTMVAPKGGYWLSAGDNGFSVYNDSGEKIYPYFSSGRWELQLLEDGSAILGRYYFSDSVTIERVDTKGHRLWEKNINIELEDQNINKKRLIYSGIDMGIPDSEYFGIRCRISELIEYVDKKGKGRRRPRYLFDQIIVLNKDGDVIYKEIPKGPKYQLHIKNGQLFGIHAVNSMKTGLMGRKLSNVFSISLHGADTYLWESTFPEGGSNLYMTDSEFLILSLSTGSSLTDKVQGAIFFVRKKDGRVYKEFYDPSGLYVVPPYSPNSRKILCVTKDFKDLFFKRIDGF